MLWKGLTISLFVDPSTRMVRARKSRQAAKKKTAEVEAAFQLDEISGSDVSIHSSEEDSYVSDDYEDDDDIDVDDDDDDVEMVRIILFIL